MAAGAVTAPGLRKPELVHLMGMPAAVECAVERVEKEERERERERGALPRAARARVPAATRTRVVKHQKALHALFRHQALEDDLNLGEAALHLVLLLRRRVRKGWVA
jgi:hypothetical protein